MQDIKTENNLTSKDFATDQEVRWCPGCGDYSILKQVQTVLPELGIPKEKIVFISGIGCSSRFPYYMETYGMHSIHGRATAIASGLKITRPDLSIWIVTGDGDSLSIGGNHLIHLLRRNIDVNILLFNNEIYGLTKGQYSPTSHEGQITKSTPVGVVDHPFNPIALALGANATFIARSMDRDPVHLRDILKKANSHKGSSLVEIYQNCNVFNDGAFEVFTEKGSKKQNTLFLEEGKPLLFGENNKYGIKLEGLNPVIVEVENSENSINDLFIHNSSDLTKATILSRMFDNPEQEQAFPRPFGIFYANKKSTYEDDLTLQINDFVALKGKGNLDDLLRGKNTWEIK
ncbi:MAG: 2-oxoacid:ferredoxin oxidoreductase subunit beta [Bacteroidota bacterium]|jgi:2-oxoglutarate ferredoxin oxidoreductase subunit beta